MNGLADGAQTDTENVGMDEKKEEAHIRLYFIRHGETAGNLDKKYVGRTDEALCAEGRESVRLLGTMGCIPEVSDVREIYISPMRRCQETAALLFPSAKGSFCVVPDFRECDFGAFEYLNYRELLGSVKLAPLYQAWIDSGGKLPFPEGETVNGFKKRCAHAFEEIIAGENGGDTCAHAFEEIATGENGGDTCVHAFEEIATGENGGDTCVHAFEETMAVENGRDTKSMVFVVHGGTIMSILEAYGEPKRGYYDYQVPCADGYRCDYLPAQGVITKIVRLK